MVENRNSFHTSLIIASYYVISMGRKAFTDFNGKAIAQKTVRRPFKTTI